jgi:hypothetical protein
MFLLEEQLQNKYGTAKPDYVIRESWVTSDELR